MDTEQGLCLGSLFDISATNVNRLVYSYFYFFMIQVAVLHCLVFPVLGLFFFCLKFVIVGT